MGRLLKQAESPGAARMMVAEFDGTVREDARFTLKGSDITISDGDLILFDYPSGLGAGITVEEDTNGLFCFLSFDRSFNIRMGLEALGGGTYAFKPAPHHVEIWPKLGATGAGVLLG